MSSEKLQIILKSCQFVPISSFSTQPRWLSGGAQSWSVAPRRSHCVHTASPSANLLRLPVSAAAARTSGLHLTGADPLCDLTNHCTGLSGDPPCISAQKRDRRRQHMDDAQQPLQEAHKRSLRGVYFFSSQLFSWLAGNPSAGFRSEADSDLVMQSVSVYFLMFC